MSRRSTESSLSKDHSAKPKSKPFQRHHTGENLPVRTTAAGSPIKKSYSVPITPTTSKLKSTTHQKPRPVSRTQHAAPNSPKGNKKLEKQDENQRLPSDAINSSPEAPRIPPTTPASRAPLADLFSFLGQQTVEKRPAREEIQPEEKVLWRISPSSTPFAGSQNTPASYRKKSRKRPRSSSPVSSPRMVDRIPEQESFDLVTFGSIRTPMLVDPAADLWNRYSTATSSQPPSIRPLAPTTNLFNGSSPRYANESPLALRRSYSCGMEWPNKRRKTVEPGSPLVEDESPEEESCSPRMSRVSDLVEKIHEKMGKPNRSSHPSWSKPLPIIDCEIPMASSPSKLQSRTQTAPNINFGRQSSDEDFGDLDIENEDVEMFSALDAAAGKKFPDHDQETSIMPMTEQSIIFDGDDDEYGGEDDDFYSADLENLMSKYEAAKQPTQIVQEETPVQKVVVMDDDEFDEFGEFDLDEWSAAEAGLAKNGVTDLIRDRIQRFLVLDVFEDSYIEKKGHTRPQKVLQLEDEKEGTTFRAILRQSWESTQVTEGNIINVIGSFEAGECIIDNVQNYVIMHPDFLLSATVVADSFNCLRLGALKDRVKAINEMTISAVYGNILHELFQTSLVANDFSDKFIFAEIDRLVIKEIQQLYTLREPIQKTVDHLRTKAPFMQDWAKKFVAFQPKAGAIAQGHRSAETNVCVNKILDVEEHIWSPKYGLKGNMDVTAEIMIREGKENKTLTVPLELKTGRNSKILSHRAQTMLYTLLMSDRYDIDSICGLLYYSETSEMIRVPALHDELRGMLIGRNALAAFMDNKLIIPPMIKRKHECGRCYANSTCFIYHKALEGGTAELSGLGDLFEKNTAHILPHHAEFFSKWDVLLTKEEKDSDRFRKELWTMQSHERENVGRCFGGLVIVPESLPTSTDASKISRYNYRLRKQLSTQGFSFLESQISVGEPIVISDEDGHFALAKGYATRVTATEISVAVDRRLHNARSRKPGFHPTQNQVFAGIMEVLENGTKSEYAPPSTEKQILFRLDKDEFANGMAMVRNNLIEMMKRGPGNRIRDLIIDLKAPTFKTNSTAYPLPSASQSINIDQRHAIEKVMSANDYALILGMPGTGKTTTIAHIIRALISQGKSVLLTSYTHTAVDNILLKIRNDGIKILRLGAQSKIHREVQEFAETENTTRTTFVEIHEALHSPQIVATTCLKVNHAVFQERVFDYCIVDEASQITLPVCLGPIRMAKTFILVGDHFQLPPLVKNAEARAGGLDISLFKLLSEAHPQAVVNLEHQYRMCEDIMVLSNTLIYDGRLKCGTRGVAEKSLHIPNIAGLDKFHDVPKARNICKVTVPCWIRNLLQEDVKARFVNTDNLDAAEVRKGERIYNPVEAQLTHQLVEALLHTGVAASEIGVISVYRAQIKAISTLLTSHPTVEMHTADRFQGRDKECIIISLVRSNDKQNIGELLNDWRRINVAFTRARTKLIILGSRNTLMSNELLGKFVDMMDDRKWVYNLPIDANLMHTTPAAQRSPRKINSPSKIGRPAKATKFSNPKKDLKENVRIPVKAITSRRAVIGARPVLRDIVNELF